MQCVRTFAILLCSTFLLSWCGPLVTLLQKFYLMATQTGNKARTVCTGTHALFGVLVRSSSFQQEIRSEYEHIQ